MTQWRFERYREAYLEMALRAKFRPGAPSDVCGNIQMSNEELQSGNPAPRGNKIR
jgi:hypothetical protein